jgi:glycosyltransferase involved in cell wall biosynthesis
MNPRLSICVPSRNRQVWFKQTITALLENQRDDVEFVFADNSDDASVMASFMKDHAADPRVVFLPPGPRVYSMVDNWERCVAATSGNWVTVIGDDDYVDPDLVVLLKKVELLIPDVDAFSWAYASFNWPECEGIPDTNITLELTQNFIDIPKSWLMRRAYQWADATTAPTHGFSIYHSALSRALIERIRERFNGRYFEHPTVDFDSSFKSVLMGSRFVMWQRPLSIQGVCPASMSSIVFDVDGIKAANVAFTAETGHNTFDDPSMEGLPFVTEMGVPAAVLATQQWIKHSAGFEIDGWQENFARSCAYYCARFRRREDFDYIAGLHRQAFEAWDGGRFAHAFNPVHLDLPENYSAFSGVKDGKIYLNNRETGARTPKEIYDVLSNVTPPIEDIVIDPASLRRPLDNADAVPLRARAS